MSQPPLSNQIKALEEELGVQLFLRGKRRLELTEEGSLLLRRAIQIQELTDKTRQEISSLREGMTGTIYLSMVEGRAPFLAARWIAGFREEFPLVRYNLWNGSSDDALDRLRKGLADLAVIAAPYDTEHLEGFPVGREPWAAMLHPDHPLARAGGGTPSPCPAWWGSRSSSPAGSPGSKRSAAGSERLARSPGFSARCPTTWTRRP